MDPSERLNLQRMIKENDVEETTDLIRNVKHSNQIRENVKILEKLRNENPEMVINNPDDFDDMCIFHCGFLFNHYTDIYNKVKKNELDMDSALRKADKLDDQHKSEPKKESKTVSWREWKKRQI